MDNRMPFDWKPFAALVIVVFIVGLGIGYLYPRDVHIQVNEASGKYVNYFNIIKQCLFPFNETDNVTTVFHGHALLINHTTPNKMGIPNFEIGFDDNGFIKYITERRE
jgi:hypothetical protein